MWKLIKFSIVLLLLFAGSFVLLGTSFGEKTLYQHLVGISETNEAKTLKTEIGKKVDHATSDLTHRAKELAIEKVKKQLKSIKEKESPAATEDITAKDQKSLESLIKQKNKSDLQAALENSDRASLNQLIHRKTTSRAQ